MADAPETEAPAAAEPAATETPSPEPASAPAAEPSGPEGLDALPESWQREVKGLREEAAKYRTRSAPYEEAFGDLDEPAREAVFEFVKAYRDDPLSTSNTTLVQWAKELSAAERGQVAEQVGAADDNAPMTRAEFQAAMAEQQQQQGIATATAELQREASELGYKDPESDDYFLLMRIAHSRTSGDLKKADELIKAREQEIVDRYVNTKKNEANGSPLVPQVGTPGTEAVGLPKTFAEARAAAMERLEHME